MADDTYDELYGDLYGDPEPTPAPVPPTTAPVEAAPAPAAPAAPTPAAATYASTPAAPSVYDTNPAQQQQPPALHFDAGYSQRAADANKTLNVRPSDMPEEGKMFIGGLNWDTTDDSLRTYFEQFGAITHSTIMRDPESQRSRGFAFLTFESASSVNAVMASEHYLDGKTIDPKRAIPRADGAKTDKLFVRSIPNSCTQESFRAFWRTFGNITDATLMMDKESGRHRGFGFVNYEDLESVEKVLRSQPHVMDGQTLEVKRAQAKGENMRQNNNNQNNNQSYQPQSNNYNNNNNNYSNNNQGGGGGGGGPNQFDPAAMAKFFQQMGWGSWNPMMLQSMGGMPGMGGGGGGGMPGMGMMGMPGMGMGMPGMGMGGMGYQGMGMGMGGMGMDPSAYGGGGGEMGGSAIPGGTETSMGPGVSAWTAPMAQSGGMRGGRGGGRGGRGGGGGGRGGFEYQGGAGGQGGMRDGQGDGASGGPTRSRGGGAGYHPYAR